MQWVTPDIGNSFGPLETALRDVLLHVLFQGVGKGTLGQGVTRLSVKQMGMSLPDPTKTAPENWTASCVITGHIVALIRVQEEFSTADYDAYMREGREEMRERNTLWLEEAMADTREGAPVQVTCCLRRETKTGSWLTVHTSKVNGMELGEQEWRDALFLRYGLEPP